MIINKITPTVDLNYFLGHCKIVFFFLQLIKTELKYQFLISLIVKSDGDNVNSSSGSTVITTSSTKATNLAVAANLNELLKNDLRHRSYIIILNLSKDPTNRGFLCICFFLFSCCKLIRVSNLSIFLLRITISTSTAALSSL